MASTYSTNLRLELMANGEDDTTWGTKTNTNLQLLEASVAGRAAVTHSDAASYTLTANNGSSDEARQMILNIGGTLTAARNTVCPTQSKLYIAKNATSGGFATTLKTAAGTGVSIPNGKTTPLYCDGTNVVDAIDYLSTLTIGSGLTVTAGNLAVGDLAGIGWDDRTAQLIGKSGASSYVQVNTNNVEVARFTPSGFRLGATAIVVVSNEAFSVDAGSNPGAGIKTSGVAGNPVLALWHASDTGNNLFTPFYVGALETLAGSIDHDRLSGLLRFNTTSDYRAKDIDGELAGEAAVARVMGLTVYRGRMKGASLCTDMLVAHEAQKHFPEAVSGMKDGPALQTISYATLIPTLIAAVQHQQRQLGALFRCAQGGAL